MRNLARAQSHRRKAVRRDLAILVRYRPGRRPTIECRVMFCEIVGSIALAGALDPEDFARRNRPISLPATDDRRSRWRVSSPKYVGRPRASLRQQVELGSGQMALLKEAPIPLPTRCELSLPSLVHSR